MSTLSYGPPPTLALTSDRVIGVHILRHPSCERGADEVCGQIDVPLDAHGLNDTQAIVRWWLRVGPKVQAIVSSDLMRCRDLAHALSQSIHVPVYLDWRLREQSFGRWEGQRWSDLTIFDPQAGEVWRNPWHSRPPEGESLADVAIRVHSWWQSLNRDTSFSQIAMVTHAGPLRVLCAGALAMNSTDLMRLAPSAPSYTELSFSNAGGVMSSFGTRPWLT
jgi:broad specificity phosphatase PhoE